MDDSKRNPAGPALKAALVAAIVVVAAGVFVWGIRTGLGTDSEPVEPLPPPAGASQPLVEVRVQPGPVKTAESPVAAAPVAAAPVAAAPVAAAPQPPVSMAWPYQGGVLRPFGWAYSVTMGDWRFHQGIDIAGNDGDEVVAAMGGRVESIEDSALFGTRLVLFHQSGVRTAYAGIRHVLVKVGDNVRASQPIASMGPWSFECLDPDHLHFEVITGKGSVDPVQFLP